MRAYCQVDLFTSIQIGHTGGVTRLEGEGVLLHGDVVDGESGEAALTVDSVGVGLEAEGQRDLRPLHRGALGAPCVGWASAVLDDEVGQVERDRLDNALGVEPDVPAMVAGELYLVECSVVVDVLTGLILALDAVLVVVIPRAVHQSAVTVRSLTPGDLHAGELVDSDYVAIGVAVVVRLGEVVEGEVGEVTRHVAQVDLLQRHRLVPVVAVAIVGMAEPVGVGAEHRPVSGHDGV